LLSSTGACARVAPAKMSDTVNKAAGAHRARRIHEYLIGVCS
jgi:hypothetical protein